MRINAYAKINIGLDVLRRRSDGYHEVRMIMQSIGIHDELDIERSSGSGIRINTDRQNLPVNEDNLVYKAARLIMDEYGVKGGLNVNLSKNIPVAAGLAGGSTDAAATLVAVNELYGLGLDKEELRRLGVRIGADVPFCIMQGTVLSEGIGEILTPLKPCPWCRILLAKPPIGVSTAYVYTHLKLDEVTHPDIDGIISGIEKGDLYGIADNMGNVLESVTIPANPVVGDIKDIMRENGAFSVLMSGSGPSVFGMFDNEDDFERAYRSLDGSGLVNELFKTCTFDPNA